MNTYILLLRGINVGGHRKIKMADLRALLEKNNFNNVASYIQSGNVVFTSDENNILNLQQRLEHNIHDHFGFEVKCFVVAEKNFLSILKENPFIKKGAPIEKLYFTFLNKTPNDTLMEALKAIDAPNDVFVQKGELLYFCYHDGYGKAKISNPFIERKLKCIATTRNYKTMLKLQDMISGI